jgi:hypothetical protein
MGFSVSNVYSNDNLTRRGTGEARDEMELVIEAKSQNESLQMRLSLKDI